MSPPKVVLKKGPARDTLIILEGREVFATDRLSYLLQSLQTLATEDSAIVLDPSHWWFDAGREPEILRLERRESSVAFVGRKRIEQTHGDSMVFLGECELRDWIAAVQSLSACPKNA